MAEDIEANAQSGGGVRHRGGEEQGGRAERIPEKEEIGEWKREESEERGMSRTIINVIYLFLQYSTGSPSSCSSGDSKTEMIPREGPLDRDGEVDGHAHMKPTFVLFIYLFFKKICNCQMPCRTTCTSEMQMVDHFLSDYN